MLPARSKARSLRRNDEFESEYEDDDWECDRGKEEEPSDAWKEFDTSTEAGRLLRKLYGAKSAPKIVYPKVKVAKRGDENRKPWHRGGIKDDPRKSRGIKQRERTVKAPIVGRGPKPEKVPAIHFAAKRKPKREIDAEKEIARKERAEFRPLIRKPITTDTEKRRLAAQFQFKGGTASWHQQPIKGNVPLGLIVHRTNKASERLREQRKKNAENLVKKQQELEKEEFRSMFRTVSSEVDQLKASIRACEGNPSAVRKLGKLKGELVSRLVELRELDETLRNIDKSY